MSKLAFRLLNTSDFNLLVNTKLPHFSVVSELLTFYKIPFKTWTSDEDLSISTIELSFNQKCKFSDVYLLAYIFKDYELKYVCPTTTMDQTIRLGVNLYASKVPVMEVVVDSMDIDSFLHLDPKLNTQYVIDNFFEEKYYDDDDDDYEEEEEDYEQKFQDDDHDHFSTYDNRDWDRETFDAMTDGNLGSYDDFHGDIDDVMTWAGH